MRRIVTASLLAFMPVASHANDWERFYHPAPVGPAAIMPADQPPVIVSLTADPFGLADSMWRKGYGVIGMSSFNSPNASTKDALRFAAKLKAAYVGLSTDLTSSQVINMPITTPTSSTSYSSGNVAAQGSGGYATGTYSGSTTTYGSQTTYTPIVQNRFDKVALYFGPLPRQGTGLLFRAATPDEIARFDSRHVLVVRSVRDGSPADTANVLEGDAVLTVDGVGASIDSVHAAVASGKPIALHLIRNGQPRDVTITAAP